MKINFSIFSNVYFYDKLLIVFLVPVIPFLANVFQLNPYLWFTRAYFFLLLLIFISFIIVHKSKLKKLLSQKYLLIIILIFSYLFIEVFHVFFGKSSLLDLSYIKMILYSESIGSILIFFSYSIYLVFLNKKELRDHLIFFVNYLSIFLFIFVFIWLFFYLNIFDEIYKFQILRSNGISYLSLFIISILLFSNIKSSCLLINKRYNFLISTTVIFLNDTRGAILALFLLFGIYFFYLCNFKKKFKYIFFMATILIFLILLFLQFSNIELFVINNINIFEYIRYYYDNNINQIPVLSSFLIQEGDLSLYSRFYTFYYTYLVLLDNPLFGIGQHLGYQIMIFSFGIHSFYLLLLVNHGLVGFLLFYFITYLIFKSDYLLYKHNFLVLLIFFIFVLSFINSIPSYYSLLAIIFARNIYTKRVIS